MKNYLPIYYLGFWDVPETFYVENKGILLYFCRDFNDEIDDYESFYKVYKVENVSINEAVRPDSNPELKSYEMLILPDFKKDKWIGKIKVDDIIFDLSKRKFIDATILETLNLKNPT